MKNEKLMVNQYFLAKDYEAFRAFFLKSMENCRGLESGPERGGIGSVIEIAMAKQVYKKFDQFTTTSWSVTEVLTVSI